MPAASPRPLRDLVDDRRDEIKAIVRSHNGTAVAVFGSVARGDEMPGSDLDFLVELEPDARPIEILSIGVALEDAVGVPVDVGTPESLRANIREAVLAEAIGLRPGSVPLPQKSNRDATGMPDRDGTGTPAGTIPVESRSPDQLAGCWHSVWHSTGHHGARFVNSCWNTHHT